MISIIRCTKVFFPWAGGLILIILLSAIAVLLFVLVQRLRPPSRGARSNGETSGSQIELTLSAPLKTTSTITKPMFGRMTYNRERGAESGRTSLVSDDSAAIGAATLYEDMGSDASSRVEPEPNWLREAEVALAESGPEQP